LYQVLTLSLKALHDGGLLHGNLHFPNQHLRSSGTSFDRDVHDRTWETHSRGAAGVYALSGTTAGTVQNAKYASVADVELMFCLTPLALHRMKP
jgi:hypothetical protein